MQLNNTMPNGERLAALKARAKRTLGHDVDRVGLIAGYCREVKARNPGVKANGGRMEVQALVTTDRVDSVREVVIPSGIDWSVLKAHKRVFADHWYGLGDVVGTFRWIEPSTNPAGWKMAFDLLPDEYSETVRQARIMAEEGAIATSIGYIPTDWGAPTGDEAKRYPGVEIVTRKAIGFEVSVVAMPCNLDAVGGMAVATEDGAKADRLRELVCKGRLSGKGLRMPEAKRETIIICSA